jgi:hypothetical protein
MMERVTRDVLVGVHEMLGEDIVSVWGKVNF